MKNELFDVEMLRRQFIRPYFIELGLTVGQGQPRILKELRLNGTMNQKELADICLMDVTTMSRTLDRLEQMGLVKREANPQSRRSWTIALTETGCEKADKVLEIFQLADETMKKDMDAQELATLMQLLGKVEENLRGAIAERLSQKPL